MKECTLNRKLMTVDGQPYVASVNAIYPKGNPKGNAPLAMRVTIRAEYAHRSVCIFRGLTNQEYWFNYSEYDPDTLISITPRVIAALVRFAHGKGWDPTNSKSNIDIDIDNTVFRSMMQNVA